MPLTFTAPIEQVPDSSVAPLQAHEIGFTVKVRATGSVPPRRTHPEWMPQILGMTVEQAATLKRLAEAAYELDAFKSKLSRTEADCRIATLSSKLKLLDGAPHTL